MVSPSATTGKLQSVRRFTDAFDSATSLPQLTAPEFCSRLAALREDDFPTAGNIEGRIGCKRPKYGYLFGIVTIWPDRPGKYESDGHTADRALSAGMQSNDLQETARQMRR